MDNIQRLRVRFGRGEELKFISHLDLMRLWHRAFIRAGIPVAYSEGFNPHPRISLALPLALGITSEAELMDVYTSRWVSPHNFIAALKPQLPAGINLMQVSIAAPTLPALQAEVNFAEYEVRLKSGQPEMEERIERLLSLESLPWQHQRDTGTKNYDLRPLIDDIWLIKCEPPYCLVGMKLRSDSTGSGRPEQVAAALGFPDFPESVHRTRIILKRGQPDANARPGATAEQGS